LWWKQRKNDDMRLEILNWSELKAGMRRKFVSPSYLKKREYEKKKIERIKN